MKVVISWTMCHLSLGHEKKALLSSWRPSLLGITVYRDVMTIVGMIVVSPKELKAQKLSSAWLLAFIYEGRNLTIGPMILSK